MCVLQKIQVYFEEHIKSCLFSRENPVLYKKTEVILRATIREVTAQHLNHTYTCVAGNTVGNSSVTIRLKLKKQGNFYFLISNLKVYFTDMELKFSMVVAESHP